MADPTTQSNYLQIATERLSLDWTLDFDAELISGSATHHLLAKADDVKEVIFDTSELDISDVKIDENSVQYDLKPKHPVMGSALHISLPAGLKTGQYVDVKIEYKTTKDCTALQWLDKAQTQGKTFSFLFSQCQPIYARAIAPLQDTPSVKIKYSAKVTSVLPVLLSAIRESPPSNGPPHDGKVIGKDQVTYVYRQPVPIPSYLIAIAAGNVVYRGFPQYEDKQWTSGIWAEPELIDSAYWEFSEDTARFLAAEEKIVTPYKFGVYDVLVLPPSFPYGGMENACLTFLTPTLLAGDRSLVDVVVHELTHSWFGNGVTHAHASHFWLNEGWTTYIERVLQEVLHSPAHRDFSFIIGSKALKNSLKEFESEPKYQRLVIDFDHGEDPDNAFSSIPYEKGANLLLHLERTLGGLDVFLPYVKDYVDTFIGKNVTTQEWKDHLYAYYEKHGGAEKIKALDSVDWKAWFYGEGLSLPVEMDYDVTLATQAYALAAQWDAARSTSDVSQLKFTGSDIEGFNSNQIIVFLERLQSYSQLPLAHVRHLGTLYKIASTPNAEIRFRFYELAMLDPKSDSAKAYAPEAVNWIIGADGRGTVVGRMKFCRPIFRTVSKADRDLAVGVWEGKKEEFHPVARRLIEKDLGLAH
ncbi:putative leukotriene A4 hydrolase, C-terminal [Lyophyllum shimeji]|uniref:Leukotriene A4 hydrolase, C-terminal n=1 Tax=Lyophyllum shimeji TaxID=47721 RepID=A0A9P3UKI3_LYOSH|nr:putative leukotriene A4 hydrolase, C-terminal [Lyophyllum shimeji]